MTVRPNVDAGRLVNTLIFAVLLLFVAGMLRMGSIFSLFVVAAFGGALIGLAVAAVRSQRGLGATETGARAPEYAGRIGIINMAHIPVMGIGGIGIVAMSMVVGLVLPEGRQLLAWSLTGAVLGATSLIMWRHFHGGTPFAEHPEETLHLR